MRILDVSCALLSVWGANLTNCHIHQARTRRLLQLKEGKGNFNRLRELAP